MRRKELDVKLIECVRLMKKLGIKQRNVNIDDYYISIQLKEKEQ